LKATANSGTFRCMSDKAFGWIVTIKHVPPGVNVPVAHVWYAAYSDRIEAMEAVREAANLSDATVEISREMSETLMTSLGIKEGEVKYFG
jgi:hypothetical protein